MFTMFFNPRSEDVGEFGILFWVCVFAGACIFPCLAVEGFCVSYDYHRAAKLIVLLPATVTAYDKKLHVFEWTLIIFLIQLINYELTNLTDRLSLYSVSNWVDSYIIN